MKKILSVIISVLVMVSCCGFTAFGITTENTSQAEEYANIDVNTEITFSEDYKFLYLGDSGYRRFDGTSINFSAEYGVKNKINLDEIQNEQIKAISLNATEKASIFNAEITFYDGAILLVNYIREDLYAIYKGSVETENSEYTVDFSYPQQNTVKANKSKFYGTEKYFENIDVYEISNEQAVYIEIAEDSVGVDCGFVFCYKNEWWFCEDGGNEIRNKIYDDENVSFTAYKIEDENLTADFEKALELFYNDDFGFIYNDTLTKAISDVFWSVLFMIVPLAISVLAVIFGIRYKKTIYGKMFTAIAGISLGVIVVFVILLSVLKIF